MTARNLADYYHWEEPGRGVQIYMNSGMADRLQASVLQTAKETGGILLGRTETEEGGLIIIEDFVPAPCSCAEGRYDLSEADTVNLEKALLRAALAACDTIAPPVLGYYRSHYRDGLSLSASDLAVIDSYFTAPANVFLLVKPVRNGKACTAGFFFWEDGRVLPEFSALEVAIGGKPAAVDDEPEVEAEDVQIPAPRPKAPPEPARARSIVPRSVRDFLLRGAIVSLAAVTVVLSVLTYLGSTRPSHEISAASVPVPAALGLAIQRNAADLLVTWNQKAPEIGAAKHATLSIRDGERQKILDLDNVQLATGAVVYTPAGDDVQFRLEVHGEGGKSVAQSVRLLLPRGGATP
jgi:hypothetical protein